MPQDLSSYIQNSNRILITSHISPDADAISSSLLVALTLKLNFPVKVIRLVLEEKPAQDLSFLSGYEEIEFGLLSDVVVSFKPELLIITDANSFPRVCRKNFEMLEKSLAALGAKIVIFDHHELDGAIQSDLLINDKRPATAEQVYATLFTDLNLKKPDGYAETTLLGIISDTQRYRFDHPGHRKTFAIVSDLLDAGASVERLEARTEQYTTAELHIMSQLLANISNSGKGYTFSYISDELAAKYASEIDYIALKNTTEEFVNRYIKYFEGNKWGFVVYPETASGSGWWGVSFRALTGSRDVAALAKQLGGGGHKSAAGAKIQAETAKKALEKVVGAAES